jgi:hypothetical protein
LIPKRSSDADWGPHNTLKKPISAIAGNEISNNDTKPHTIDTTSQTISSTSSISSVQFSLLIAMPSPPPYTTNSTIHREDENFPDVEIGSCCVDVDKVTKDVRPHKGVGVSMRRQVEGMNSTSVIPDTRIATYGNAVR